MALGFHPSFGFSPNNRKGDGIMSEYEIIHLANESTSLCHDRINLILMTISLVIAVINLIHTLKHKD